MTANEMDQAQEIQESYSDELTEEENMFIEIIMFEDKELVDDDKAKFIDILEKTIGYGRE